MLLPRLIKGDRLLNSGFVTKYLTKGSTIYPKSTRDLIKQKINYYINMRLH